MKLTDQTTDEVVLRELGERLARMRLNRNLTQAELARQAGVSKRTVERLEAGDSAQLSSFVRLCRALELLGRFEALFPAPVPSPMAQLERRGKERRRASAKKGPDLPSGKWTWGDDE